MNNSTVSPIFVRGMSRSGGTLVVTLLDANPALAMSYEIYPHLLSPEKNDGAGFAEMMQAVKRSRDLTQAGRRLSQKGMGRFLYRCARGGLDLNVISALLKEHHGSGMTFAEDQGRMQFMERCCRAKMASAGKFRWGLKITGQYEAYADTWPDACFINVIRDGRDVLASQLRIGSFQKAPEDVARGWVSTHLRFRAMCQTPGFQGLEVRYEQFVQHPEQELRRVCDFVNIEYEPNMLHFHRQDLTIHRAQHLSSERVGQPIDASRVGRWVSELTRDQIEAFEDVAGDALSTFGYNLTRRGSSSAHRPN